MEPSEDLVNLLEMYQIKKIYIKKNREIGSPMLIRVNNDVTLGLTIDYFRQST